MAGIQESGHEFSAAPMEWDISDGAAPDRRVGIGVLFRWEELVSFPCGVPANLGTIVGGDRLAIVD